jgi:hypothetical protein
MQRKHTNKFSGTKNPFKGYHFPPKRTGIAIASILWSLFLLVYFRRGMGVRALRTRKKGY